VAILVSDLQMCNFGSELHPDYRLQSFQFRNERHVRHGSPFATTSQQHDQQTAFVNQIRLYYCALVAACVHLLIRLYAEGIRGYCAIKQNSKKDRQCVWSETRRWYQKETNSCRVVSV
jgi:hypothetical protein